MPGLLHPGQVRAHWFEDWQNPGRRPSVNEPTGKSFDTAGVTFYSQTRFSLVPPPGALAPGAPVSVVAKHERLPRQIGKDRQRAGKGTVSVTLEGLI